MLITSHPRWMTGYQYIRSDVDCLDSLVVRIPGRKSAARVQIPIGVQHFSFFELSFFLAFLMRLDKSK